MHKIATAVAFCLFALPVMAGETPSPPGAKVFFVNLHDGDTAKNPVLIQMGIEGMTLAPAGSETPATGHHHLFVDVPAPEGEALNEAIPKDDTHLHFGKGQSEIIINLTPGPHTLQLVLGDWSHIPHNPPVMSESITITLK